MGRTIRRMTEAVLQGLQFLGPVADKTFQPTSNSRNEVMLKEAAAFSLHIRTMERDLRAMEKQMTGQFANLRDIMITPLPKVYDRVNEEGEVLAREEPAAAGRVDDSIGNNVNYDRMEGALSTMKVMLEDEVYRPMQDWLKEFKRVQGEMKVLEALRLELDSRKRTVAGLDRKLTLQRDKSTQLAYQRQESSANGAPLRLFGSARYGGGAPETKLEDVMERTAQIKAKKEEKTGDSQDRFYRMEQDVFASLEALILWAGRLREVAAVSLFHAQECLTSAVSAFDAPASATPQLQLQQQHVEHAGGQFSQAASVFSGAGALPADQGRTPPAPRSTSGYSGHPAKDQSIFYDQAHAYDAMALPAGKAAAHGTATPAPVDAAPRYIQRAAAHPGSYATANQQGYNPGYNYSQAAW